MSEQNIITEIKLSNNFIKEINKFDNIYIEISGGYNSTITSILFFEFYQSNNFYQDIFLLHNDTKLQYKKCLENIQKVIKITNFPIIFKQPNLKKHKLSEIMKQSFQNIELAKNKIKTHNYRDYFNCCKILKNTHSRKWNNDFLLDNSIVISSITPYESFNRLQRLYQLKKQDTYIRFHKTQNIFKGYPYRDLLIGNSRYSRDFFDKLFKQKLKEYNLNIIHSGCRICPIRILFPEMLEKNDCSIKYNRIINNENF